MKLIRIIILILLNFGVYLTVYAEISVNEIAWMGTANSSFEEWIELYNSGSEPVSLSGWKLIKSGDVTLFTLSKTIEPGQYLLVCRTVGSVPNPLGGSCAEKGTFGGSGLNNENEVIILKNSQGSTIESITSGPKWKTIGGNASTKETAQKTGDSTWITASSTPGESNATAGSDPSGNGDEDSGSDSDDETIITSDTKTDPYEDFIKNIEPDPKYSTRMITPDIFIQQVPLEFSTIVKKDSVLTDLRGRFEWSMGDGGSFVFRKSTPFTYVYSEPGEYIVSLRYYSDVFKEKPDTLHQKTITVIPAQVTVSRKLSGTITLQNTSTDLIDLGNWKMIQGGSVFTFPQYTLLKKGGTISIPYSVHQLPNTGSVMVITPTGYSASEKIMSSSGTVKTKPVENTITDIGLMSNDSENLYIPPEKQLIENSQEKQPINPWMTLFGLLVVIGATIVYYLSEQDTDNGEEV